MAHRADRKVELRTWGSEAAGQQVARLESVATRRDTQFEEGKEFLDINIAVSQIGEGGARFGYTIRWEEDKERHIFFPDDVSGFVAAAGLRSRLYPGITLELDPPRLWGTSGERAGDGLSPDSWDSSSDKSLIEGGEELLATLRDSLTEHGMADLYPGIYYRLNIALGHVGVRRAMEGWVSPRPMNVIADPTMSETTQKQLEAAGEGIVALEGQSAEDEKIETAFITSCFKDIPEQFETSRLKMAQLEAKIVQLRKSLLIPSFIFLPTGSSRSWPFMDAAQDPDSHFGREIKELREGNFRLAMTEIRREREELDVRKEYAYAGHDFLYRLAQAEIE